MKDMFPQYNAQDTYNFPEIWRSAVFVFDTNVLLSLYRYRESTRSELLNVLKKLRAQIWIPYHVALEFQRNRLGVIADQNSKFSEVKMVVESLRMALTRDLDKLQLKKKHSLIQPDSLIDGFNDLAEGFLLELEILRKSQRSLTKFDALKDEIEELFNGRVGPPPRDQGEIDILHKEGENRYKLKIPPGYLDAEKEKSSIDEFPHGGILYKRKFGDYVIWDQIVKKAKGDDLKAVLFITDDVKEDWWHRLNAEGPKTLGPRPELIEEIRRKGGVEVFLMYTTESFLKYAGEIMQAHVSADTLSEIRDLSSISQGAPRIKRDHNWNEFAYHAVHKWLSETSDFSVVRGQDPDFRGRLHDESYAIDVAVVKNRSQINEVVQKINTLAQISNADDYDHYNVIFAAIDLDVASALWAELEIYDLVYDHGKFRAIVGTLDGFEFKKVQDQIFAANSA